jgi:hypothetical protein
MLTLGNILTNTMTLSKTGTQTLTQEEWDELVALKNAINEYPGTVCPQKMEKFTELLVRSLEENLIHYLQKTGILLLLVDKKINIIITIQNNE